MSGAPQQQGEDALRLAVVGVSPSRTCGVRDHARVLSEALVGHGVLPTWHWLGREASTRRGARAEGGERGGDPVSLLGVLLRVPRLPVVRTARTA